MFDKLLNKFKAAVAGVSIPAEERRAVIRIGGKGFTVNGHDGAKGFQCDLLDVSVAGARIRAEHKLKVGARVRLSKDTLGDSVNGRVVWAGSRLGTLKNQYGVVFEETKEVMARSWTKRCLQQLGLGSKVGIKERRRTVRMPTNFAAAMGNFQGEIMCDGKLVQLSAGGCVLAIPGHVDVGTRVSLMVPALGTLDPLICPGTVKHIRKAGQTVLAAIEFYQPNVALVVRYLNQLANT
ncbi:MAG: PilZ domain-containing protein [Candidatus Eremiobacteraeota bacterium]|nr:PilZ domain-containing protein [Candidatus Eremiobacteraeota bacterium]